MVSDLLSFFALIGAWVLLFATFDAVAIRQRLPWPLLTLAVILVGAVTARVS